MPPCDAGESGLRLLLELAGDADRREGLDARHSRAVAAVARALAVEVGLGSRGASLAHVAGLLHDVGKVGVPAAVLRKPAPLGRREHELVRAVPLRGAVLVRSFGDPLVAAVVAACHERWDGRGYPAGAAGADPPAEARVLAVANALVSMTAARAYRPPVAVESALAEVALGRARRYDPDVVAAALELAGEGRLPLSPEPAAPLAAAV